ncbi:MAG: sigma-70 family RNA polymerase sigma factor [Bacteroidia bacterium]|jgi:RNA polymerase sigma-70 factor (ECF subfamily)|nr:sigma-70 family RNA polymerase sigma factor [Bacteroidia bacterium]
MTSADNEAENDAELLEKFRNESTRNFAFHQIVTKYQKRVYWQVRRLVIDHDDANDVVQNVFVKVWKNLHNFKEASRLYTWLYRIAVNESLTFIKQKKLHLFVPFEKVEYGLSRKLHDDNYFKGEEVEKKLQQAILTLPEKQRIVFNLKYFEEMKYEDMAETLDTSVGALKASYHHAVKKIEEFLKKN